MNRFAVPPAGFAWFDDYPIQDAARVGVATGLVEARIRYGKLGRMKYELRGKKQVHLKFDPSGAVLVAFNDVA